MERQLDPDAAPTLAKSARKVADTMMLSPRGSPRVAEGPPGGNQTIAGPDLGASASTEADTGESVADAAGGDLDAA